MKFELMPGYNKLFGADDLTYEDYVKDIPSKVIIKVLSRFNLELDVRMSSQEIQKRLRKIISTELRKHQLEKLEFAFYKFKKTSSFPYEGLVFARRYLLEMIAKEANRDFTVEEDTDDVDLFRILMAYFKVIDEVHREDEALMEELKKSKESPEYKFMLLWASQIRQYHYNEFPIIPFEVFKLISLLKFLKENYINELKSYLNGLGFTTIGQFIVSTSTIALATMNEMEGQFLKKNVQLKVDEGLDESHLRSMCLNELAKSGKEISPSDTKTHPLYFNGKTYEILDNNQYIKKIYKGPFFEILRKTKLKESIDFNKYSQLIAKEVMEKVCFKKVIENLYTNKSDIVLFDEGEDGHPDCYYRRNNIVFVFEFKSSIMAENLIQSPNYPKLKTYIDQRLVTNGKRPKGITQLANQISFLKNKKLSRDSKFWQEASSKRITVYPILCYDEFHFSLPGINEYLNQNFSTPTEDLRGDKFNIKPVTLVSIEILYSYCFEDGNMKSFGALIDRYWDILNKRKKKATNPMEFGNSTASFQEIYQTIFRAKKMNELHVKKYKELPLSEEEMNEVLS